MIRGQLAQRAQQLTADRVPFVLATVVRARQPTSVRAGDSAIVLGDGTIDGFVGGTCATSSVRLHSLRALETGEAVLLRLVPDDGGFDPEAADGTVVVEHNPCLSGGALEIFLEPQLPAARACGGRRDADRASAFQRLPRRQATTCRSPPPIKPSPGPATRR